MCAMSTNVHKLNSFILLQSSNSRENSASWIIASYCGPVSYKPVQAYKDG